MTSNISDVPTLAVGDELTPMSWETGPANWNRFAAVNDEFIGIHMDDAIAQRAGFATAIGMGNLQYSYMHIALRDWFGLDSIIDRVDIRFKQPNVKGQTVRVEGRVTAIDSLGAYTRVGLDLAVNADDGAQLSTGAAVVRIHVDES
jgi:acyl dehydratase